MRSTQTQEKQASSIITDPDILLVIKNEHKYTLMLLSVIREQLSEFDIGKTPDYQLMFDSMQYMADFPQKFNHPVKNKLIQAIIDKDPANSEVLETLLAEKRQINSRSKEVIAALKSLLKEETILKEEQLKIFCKNYVELIESHIEIESQLLFAKTRSILTADEIKAFHVDFHEENDQALADLIEDRYKELSKVLNQRWENLEEAANDFALAEFVGMGALFETIEPLSIGLSEISKIIKEYSYKLYLENYNCYKDLFSKQQPVSNYIEKPKNCFLACYKDYVDGLGKINDVVKKTKGQIVEPYSVRKDYYHPDDIKDLNTDKTL